MGVVLQKTKKRNRKGQTELKRRREGQRRKRKSDRAIAGMGDTKRESQDF